MLSLSYNIVNQLFTLLDKMYFKITNFEMKLCTYYNMDEPWKYYARERSQTQKNKYHGILHLWGTENRQIQTQKVEQRLPGAGEMQSYCLIGTVSVWDNENILETVMMFAQHHKCT